MTAVVGVRGRKGVLLAGDSMWSNEWSTRMRRGAKTFQLSEVVAIAYCGSGRLGQILTYHLNELEEPPLGVDEHRWAIKEFVPHLREVLETHGFLHVHHNVENIGDSGFLLAIRDRLFTVEGDLQVGEDTLAFTALGSGEDVAIGAMRSAAGAATEALSDSRLERIATEGVRAATELTPYVGGDITFVRTVTFSASERALAREIVAHGRR